jgi:conjugal transfer pilus assembly protein TraF
MMTKLWGTIVSILMCSFITTQAVANTNPEAVGFRGTWWDESPWGDPERGFHWYPDPTAKPRPEKQEAEKQKPKAIYEMNSLDDINKELKRLKEQAILNPTEQNIHEFLKAQDWIMGKSATFADATRRVVWAKPDLNYQARSPAANFSRMKEYDRKSKSARKNVQDLAKNHGLIFFARSDCNFCHDQAPVLKWVESEMGIQVMAISLDGGPIPMYPDAKKDNGVSMMVSGGEGVSVVPAIYLVNRETKEVIPLGTGVIAGEELAERIWTLTKTKPGEGL